MFKNQIVYYLNKYLGEYVYGLDAESLRISLWQGDVELKNLQLKPEALQKLDLPIHVKAGLLGRLTLKVPWNKLGQEPVVAEFDRLYIVAGPRLEEEEDGTAAPAPAAAAGSTTAAAVKQAEQAAKEKRIDAAEQQWVKSLQEKEALAKLQGSSASSGGAAAAGAGPAGRLQALIDTVVGNLELRISNIHVRYEDPVSNPGQFFAIGLLLEEVSAHTVDERGRRAFVSADALLTLRKGVELKSLSVYFDCGATPLEPAQPWPSLPTASWDALLLPANHLPEGYHHGPLLFSTRSSSPSKGLPGGTGLSSTHSHPHSRSSSPSRQLLVTSTGTAPFEAPHPGSPKRQGLAGLLPSPAATARQQHQYLLAPVDGTLTYIRRGAKSRHTERDAHQEVHLALRSINLRLHQQQYVSAQKLLQEFDRYAASAPHRHLRPNCRPSPGVGARLWWRYAIHVVQRQQQRQHYTWTTLRTVASIRRQYVPYYLKLLQQGKQGGDATIAAWDAELDETAALLFRRMARAKYIALKQKSEGSSGGQRPAQQQQQTWWGWMRGSSPATSAATPARSPSPAPPGSLGPVDPEPPLLDAGEWAALDQVLSEQEAALSKTDDDTPYTVRLRLGVVVDVAAVELQGASGVLLMQGSLDAVEGCVTSYPVTSDITLKMGMFGINSAHGPLVSSGLITGAATAGAAEGSPAPQQQQQRKAMDLHVVRQPQDGTADLQVTVKLAPSYVTYKQAAIAEVQKFFSSGEQQLELSALQAQAAGRADKLRRIAQTQLNAMSQRNAAQKPRLQLKMTLNAPKVAIPSADEQTTLVADLGCFMFDSDAGLLASLSPEEAAVYECFTVKVDHVSAYLLEGPFAWPTAEEVLEAPARSASTASIAASRLRPSSSASSLSAKAAAAAVGAAGGGGGSQGAPGASGAASPGLPGAVSAPPGQERGLHATYSSSSTAGLGEGRRGGGSSGLMEALAQRCKLVTLLDRFGAGMDLQVATSMHPRYPVLRLAVNASPIRLHLSPHRFQHLMAVLMSLGTPAEDAAAGAAAGPTKPLWLTDAEYNTKVSVLTAETMVGTLTSGGSAARWSAKRWLHVWRGRLYLTAGAGDAEPLATKTYWRGYKVVLVPPGVLKGDEHAVAILPQGVKLEGLAEAGDALVLRVRDASAAAELRKKLVQSSSQMAAVAGLLQMSDTSDDTGAIGTTHDVFEELLSHQLLLELSGTIPEVQLLMGGRSPVTWWPPSSHDVGDPGSSVADNLSMHSGGSSMDIDAGTAAALAAAGPGSMSERPRRPLSSSSSFSRSAVSQGAAAAAQSALLAVPGGARLTSLEEEVDLVAIRFQGARVNFVMGGDGMRVDVVMRALQVDDLLVGARNLAKAHLARSEVVQRAGSSSGEDPGLASAAADLPDMPSQGSLHAGEGSQAESLADDEEEDEFFDAEEGPATPRTPSRASRRSSGGGSSGGARSGQGGSGGAGAAAGGGGAAADALRPASVSGNPQGDLVRLCFVRLVPTSSRYTGTDVELVLQLSSLVFYCHRPTVAALMVLGTDMGAISSQLAGPAAPEAPTEAPAGPEEGSGPDGSSTAETDSVADTQLVRAGGEARTMFKLSLLVSKVELHLDYEGFTTECMAIGAMQDFAFHLSVHPATLALTASLGNLVAEYGALPPGHPNRTILTMREGTSGSLIDVVFKLHSLAESFSQPRVPPGLPFMSVATRLSTVQVVFMQRFLNEFLAYLAVMFAMQPPPKVLPGQAPAAAVAGDATAASPPPTAAAAGPAAGMEASSSEGAALAGAPTALSSGDSASGDTGASGDNQGTAAQDQAVTPAAPPAANPLILLLDVVLEAPVIVIPLASGSQDHMEVDLGTLEVSNRVMWEVKGQGAARQRLLLDQLQVKLSKVSGCVVAEGQRGRNVIREMGGGIRVAVSRPLLAEPLPAPPLSTDVTVPQLRLSLLDSEYKLILDILAANFSEPSALPPEVAYLHQKLLVAPASPADGTSTPAGGSPEPAFDVEVTEAKVAQPPAGGEAPAQQPEGSAAATAALEAKREAVRRFTTSNASLLQLLGDVCVVRVTVKIGAAQLMLWNKQQDGSAPLPLGGVQLSNMWLGLSLTRSANMLLSLSLPVVFVRDLRPGVPLEASLVLSTAGMGSGTEGSSAAAAAAASGVTGDIITSSSGSGSGGDGGAAASTAVAPLLPSLLTLEYRAVRSLGPELASGLQVRLQRPTLVLDIAFLMRVLNFVVPAVGTQGPQTRPYATHEIHLGAQPYLAEAHVWLSPEYRIIADAPGVKEFVYDGRGHALVLPAGLPATEHVPLIVVGRNKVLRLRNVKVANVGALAAVLDLGPGARLVAEPAEGVKLVEEEGEGALGKRYQRFMSSLRASQRRRGSLDGAGPALGATPGAVSPVADPSGAASTSGAAGGAADAAAVPATMDIHLSAVGAAIYLLDARSSSSTGLGTTTSTTAAAAPANSSSRLGHGSSAPDVGRLTSTASISGSSARAKSEGSLLGAGGGAGAGGGDSAGAELLYMLAVALDLGLDYQMRPTTQHIRAELLNLCIKAQARLLEESPSQGNPDDPAQDAPPSPSAAPATTTPSEEGAAAAAPAPAGAMGAGEGPAALRQSVAVNILDPVNLVVNTWLSPDRQAVDVEMSALRVKLSPDVLQLILHLQKVVLEPLVVPPATAPVVRCASYERLWSSYCPGPAAAAISGPWPTAGAGGVDVMAATKGVTVWRPQPPMGYAVLGDVLTAGSTQPDHQVLVVAINSGLVTHPLGYTRVWSSNGIVLWRPNPPPGYVAMGCIATLCGVPSTSSTSGVTSGTTAGDAGPAADSCPPPPLRAMVVVAQQAAVEALAGACMLFTSAGNLWSIQNSAATFDVSSGDTHCPGVTLYDLRSPLGLPPAALSSSAPGEGGVIHLAGQVQVPPSLLAARRFKQERAQLRAAISSSGQVTYVVEFERLWWDKYAKHPSDQGVSFWRPKTPPGYVALGDVVSSGRYAPPCEVLVVRDNGHDEGLTGPPPLAHPVGYRLVWQDDHKRNLRDPAYLCLWEPIPPPGFVAAGMVATTGGGSLPPNDMIRCLRADLASRADASTAVSMSAYKERQPMRVWVLDERCSTFCLARGGEERPSGSSTWRLRPDVDRDQLEAGRRGTTPAGTPGVPLRPKRDISLRLQQLNLLLRNMLRTPVLEFEARGPTSDAIKMGLFAEPTGVTRSFAQLTSSIWSYNPRLEVWEPVITPWQLLVKCDHNPNVVTCEGVSPGTQLDIKSTMGDPVHVTLAHAAINSIFDVLADWQGTSGSSGGGAKSRTGLAAADGLTVDTTVTNTLDESAYMQLDFGDRKEVVALPARATVSMHQPVPQVPQSHAPISSQLAPPVRLLVDVVEGRLPAGLAAAGSTPELFVKVELVGLAAQKATVSGAPGRTAAQPPSRSRSGSALSASSLAQPELGADGWGLTTRAIAPTAGPGGATTGGSAAGQQQQAGAAVFVFPWRERFMVTLPQNLTENLLSPAPGDNPFAGVTDQLRVSVWDASAAGGVGGLLATKVLPLQYNWLQHELQQALLKRQAAGSSGAAAAAAAASGSSGPPGLQRAASARHSNYVTLSMELTGEPAGAAAAAEEAGGGRAAAARPPAELEAGQGLDPAAAFQLRLALRIDDSQVDPSWFPKRRDQQQAALVAAAAAAQGSSATGSGSASSGGGLGSSGRGWQAALASRHALRLTEGAVWCPFSWSNLQRTPGGGGVGGHSAVLPIKGIARGLALEVEYAVGAYHVQLRSLCCFYNDTDMSLEVALLEDTDSSYTMVPHASAASSYQAASSSFSRGASSSSSTRGLSRAALGSSSSSASATAGGGIAKDTSEERLYEFERYMPFASPGWSSGHLLPADPKHWSQLPKGGYSSHQQPLVSLPQGWEWEGPWEVEHHPCVDAEGWAYAFDFPHLHWPPEPGDGNPNPLDTVRRRAWVRRRRRVALPSTVLDVSTSSTTSASSTGTSSTGAAASSTPGLTKPEQGDGWTRRVLGVVEPGGRLPLPHTWQRDNTLNSKQLQVRPVIGTAAMRAAAAGGGLGGAASHSWSYGASQGHHSVLLTALEDGDTRLLCCKTLSAAPAGEEADVLSPKRATAHAPAAWLAALCECTPLRLPGGLDTLPDWRVTVRPPLHLVNELPVAALYQLWEGGGGLAGGSGSGGLQLRQQGRLEGGEGINVYSVDMRRQIYLQFYPEGGQWVDRGPVLISGGFQSDAAGMAGTAGDPPLPPACTVNYSNSSSTMGLRLGITRELDQELVDSQRLRMAATRAAAAGGSSASGGAAGAVAAAAAVQKVAAQGMDTVKLSFGSALAQGRVLTLRLNVPAWVVNGTQMPVTLGLVPVTPDTSASGAVLVSEAAGGGQEGLGRSDSSGRRRRSRASGGGGGTSGVLFNDAVLGPNELKPVAVVTVMPNSVELLSAPQLAAQQQGEGGGPVRWAAALCMEGSRWTKAIPLMGGLSATSAATNAAAAAVANAAATAGSAVEGSLAPLLVRARCRDGCLHEMVAQVHHWGSGLQQAAVLHLAPHIVVTNRTGYPLLLLQTEPLRQAMSGAASAAAMAGAGYMGQQYMVPGQYGQQYRGSSGTALAGSGGSGAWFPGQHAGAGGAAAAGGGGVPGDFHPTWIPSPAAAQRTAAAGLLQPPAMLSGTGAAPGIQHPAVTLIRPGSVGLPVAWQPQAAERQLSVMLPPAKAASGAPLDPLMWSAPFTVRDNMEPLQLLLPAYRLGTPGEPQEVDDASRAAALKELDAMVLPGAKSAAAAAAGGGGGGRGGQMPGGVLPTGRSDSPTPGASPTASSSSSSGGRGPGTAPLLVELQKDMDAGMQGYLAVVLQLKVEERGPGCLHLILESLGGEPEHLIQNCLPAPLCYRQDTSTASWQQLPPLSAAALVLQQPPGAVPGASAAPAPPVVEVRDADPGTSGGGMVRLDDLGAGGAALPAAFAGRGSVTGEGEGGRGTGGGDLVFRQELAVGNRRALALVSPLYEAIMAGGGPQEVPGGGAVPLGGTATDRALRVVPKQGFVSAHQLHLAAALSGKDRASTSPGSRVVLALELGALDVSLVDAAPRELLLVTLEGLGGAVSLGHTLGTPFQAVVLRLASIQVDDMLQGTPFPVLLTCSTTARRNSSGGAEGGPALQLDAVRQPERIKGLMYLPTLVFRAAPLQVSISENLVWAVLEFGSSLAAAGGGGGSSGAVMGASSASGSSGSGKGGVRRAPSYSQLGAGSTTQQAGAAGRPAQQPSGGATRSSRGNSNSHQAVSAAAADVPMYVNLLSLDEVKVTVNVRADRARRPRWAAAKYPILGTLGDLLNVEDLEVTLPELEFENERLLRSRLVGQLVSQMQGQLLGIMFNVLRSYGVLGGGARFMSVVGTMMQNTVDSGAAATAGPGRGEVSNVGQAFLEGGKTFGKSLLKGVTGIVTNPLEGAEKAGLLGFAKGVGKGIIGVPMTITGGAVLAAAQVAEGFDASLVQVKEAMKGTVDDRVPRRRLPRAVRGDRVLTVYARRPAAGQALLFTCGPVPSLLTQRGGGVLGARVGGSSGSMSGGTGPLGSSSSSSSLGLQRRWLGDVEDAYEGHEVLMYASPPGDVVLLTSARVMLVRAEEFGAIQDNREITKVPSGVVLWQLTWDQLLTTELYSLPGAPHPAGVILHRRQRGPEPEGRIAQHIPCWGPDPMGLPPGASFGPPHAEASAQAARLQAAIVATRGRFYLTPRREVQGWSAVPVTAVEQQPNQAMPDTIPCMHYKQVWTSTRPGRRPLTIWRPQGPPGYWPLGDVAMPGTEPPAAPVKVYREAPSSSNSTSSGGAAGSSRRPPLAPPSSFQLLFRDSRTGHPVTIWRPLPPAGYVVLGDVVVPAIDEPPAECVRCLREDLGRQARFFDSHVWAEASSDNANMLAALWQVDNACHTFVATRGSNEQALRPTTRQPLAPAY